jgi:DNA-binding NarL/FixJ family response regulator
MAAERIRVLLVDDDAFFLRSLEVLLTDEPGLEIVGKAASGQEALAAAARTEPDVAVIDVLMPAMSGIECARLLRQRYPKARVILISGSIEAAKRFLEGNTAPASREPCAAGSGLANPGSTRSRAVAQGG